MSLIPPRNISAISGSEFAKINMNIDRITRENNIVKELSSGNIPSFLRNFKPITIHNEKNSLTYLVSSDSLSVGSIDDYIRVPLGGNNCQEILDMWDCSLPTRLMVKQIWKQAEIKLNPLPWGPPYNSEMMSMDRIQKHNQKIQNQLKDLDNTKLIAGHKKSVVLTNKLQPNNPYKRVAIFGWIQKNGKEIQGLNSASHEINYSDYSHQVRAVANDVMLNNSPARLQDIFQDKTLCNLISDEGPLNFLRY